MNEASVCSVGGEGNRCGKPAVISFIGLNGVAYAECEDHAPAYASRKASQAEAKGFKVGSRVRLVHGGIVKNGVVVWIGRSRVRIEVPIIRSNSVKVIERAIADVELISR